MANWKLESGHSARETENRDDGLTQLSYFRLGVFAGL